MWLAMTGVMMAPVVLPWVRALHRLAGGGSDALPLAPFVAGYGAAWSGFSAAAAGVHAGLPAAGVPVPFGLEAPTATAALLVAAGLFQFTKLKQACLTHCRSPAGYLLAHWRSSVAGWTRLGARHGLYCIGCCWALMLLALAAGMAGWAWMGGLTVFMAAETTLPFGRRMTKPAGCLLVAAGVGVLWL